MHLLIVVTALSTIVMAGNEVAVGLFLHPALRETGDQAVTRWLAQRLGLVMPYWYGANLLLMIALVWLSPSFGAIAAASVWAGIIVYTLLALVPLNQRVAASSDGDNDWRAVHERWNRRHQWRIAALMVSVTCYLSAVVR